MISDNSEKRHRVKLLLNTPNILQWILVLDMFSSSPSTMSFRRHSVNYSEDAARIALTLTWRKFEDALDGIGVASTATIMKLPKTSTYDMMKSIVSHTSLSATVRVRPSLSATYVTENVKRG